MAVDNYAALPKHSHVSKDLEDHSLKKSFAAMFLTSVPAEMAYCKTLSTVNVFKYSYVVTQEVKTTFHLSMDCY